ncbi:germacradienol/geosmin synthase [Lentzea xinjiangensis]|uniref:Germacradienol/geosmin synthase n=2 Tax=Lentzea xinjiangensis TaxID=402600 RepID=A0A1H9QML3_9PSEU|nr:germacradienol/geosmin synthase [Lentzea xinjiangensis]
MPFAARLSPHADRVRLHTRTWARDMGMFDGMPWTEARYDAADYGGFGPLTHPTLPLADLKHVNDWHTWGFHVSDVFRDRFLRPRDVAGGKAFVAELRSVLAGTAAPVGPAGRGLADLLSRSTVDDEDRHHLGEHLDALLWELHNTAQGRVPDPVDLVEMRRRSIGAELSAKLLRGSVGAELPPELLRNSTMRALVDSFGDVAALRQEIVGFDHVHATGASTTSAVLAVRQFFDCGLEQAVSIVADLISARLRQIVSIIGELPAVAAEHDLDAEARAGLHRYAEALKSWLAGELLWTRRSGRFSSSPTPVRRPFHRPAGLGTAAVLVSSPR